MPSQYKKFFPRDPFHCSLRMWVKTHHESVRDFLLKEDGLSNIWADLRGNFLGQSHERLKQYCLNYMSVDVSTSLNFPKRLPKASSPQAADLRKLVHDAFPFLEYSVHHVLYHADAAEENTLSQAQFLESFPLSHWVRLDNLFEKHEVRRHSTDVSLSYHSNAASCLEVEHERYGPPMFAAMATGSKEALKIFLKHLVGEPASRTQTI
jgi:hypothetical protein